MYKSTSNQYAIEGKIVMSMYTILFSPISALSCSCRVYNLPWIFWMFYNKSWLIFL